MRTPRTLYNKLIDRHVVRSFDPEGRRILLYVDRTVLNEYTSPQAFTGMRQSGRKVWRANAALGTVDHVNPTVSGRRDHIADEAAARQVSYFLENCRDFGIEVFDLRHRGQGIEHVVMTELGLVLPGLVIAAGDSHTTTYGALGALGFGIGTSDIEHYLASQTLPYTRLKSMLVHVDGRLAPGVRAKDIVMELIRQIGASGAVGYAIEFAGDAISTLSIEGRMTICNMAVECGARGAIVAPDNEVLEYLERLPRVPRGILWESAVQDWATLASDEDATFERRVDLAADRIEPMVTWGTSPDQALPITGRIPNPAAESDPDRRRDIERALAYMGLKPGTALEEIRIDRAFIGSCTNSRIEDLRDAALVIRGRRIAPGVSGMVVPGSSAVKRQAEAEGLHSLFMAAGFEWRESGCSMCLAMNNDVLKPGERCASSTNRNFEGRQGAGGRTHLMSPAMVVEAAMNGRLSDPRTLQPGN